MTVLSEAAFLSEAASLTDAALAEFVATSAAILGLPLDDQELAAARDTMRGLLNQAALVLDYPEPPAGT